MSEREALVELLRECKELADADAMDAKDNLQSSAHAYFNSLCGRLSGAIAALTAPQPQPVAPKWYSRNEIIHVLHRMKYSDEIAQELADWMVRHLQLAFNKGFQMASKNTAPQQEPSGVREGMLRAAEICKQRAVDFCSKAKDAKRDRDFSAYDSFINSANNAEWCAEAIARAAETINAEGRAEAVGTIQVGDNRTADGDTPVPSAPTPQQEPVALAYRNSGGDLATDVFALLNENARLSFTDKWRELNNTAPQPDGVLVPRANADEEKGGWTISPKYLDKVRKVGYVTEECMPSMEEIEVVLLAHLQLAAAKESEQTHVRVPVDKLTISDCYRFGIDISSIRSTATGKESEHGK